ncbi:ABC transporter ATP-binding protein [Mangrovivirga sp. M17]|uniref:ABC transporter ATP-binding protein n=1 Tax=Mangrovivirga halotolerans TaxID=2993936 RepID=A0ABT3RP44_9BACT|nr:ABC transporter ATP-binding protein [Mangrovivirga halotolerans]MCX2743561.1 ABC transporter ATP-binding protein [Mangrovivirga halotolerans]
MIELKNIYKAYKKVPVLKGVSLKMEKGGVYAVLGPNGSGKTTLMKCILGMVLPDRGEVFVGGESVIKKHSYRENIGYLPQIARFPDNLKVEELFKMISDLRGQKGNSEDLIQRFGLEKYLSYKLSSLSGGTRQKVNLVICFMFDAQYILLDEPTSGLDPVAMIALRKLIEEKKQEGKIIILTTHIMDVVEKMADEIIFLMEGKIYFQGDQEKLDELTGSEGVEASIAQLLLKEEKGKNDSSQKNGFRFKLNKVAL